MKRRLSVLCGLAVFLLALGGGFVTAQDDSGSDEKGEIFDKTVAKDKLDDAVIVLDVSGSMAYWDEKQEDEGPETGKDENDQGAPEQIELPDGRTITKKDLNEHPRSRIGRAKWEMINLIMQIPEGNDFNFVFYSTEVDIAVEGEMIKANDKTRMKMIKKVYSLNAEGATRTDQALKKAFDIKETKYIYLISDGAPMNPNKKSNKGYMDTQKILNDVKSWNKDRNVTIHSLGFDQIPVVPEEGVDNMTKNQLEGHLPEVRKRRDNFVNFMKDLAKQNDGDYTSIK